MKNSKKTTIQLDTELKTEYLVAIYSFLQLSMVDVDLLNKNGSPIKKKYTQTESDAMYLYRWLSEQLKDIDIVELRSMAKKTDIRVSKLLNDHTVVNNFLLAVYLLREYVDQDGSKMEQILLSGKINRIIDLLDEAVTDEEFSVDTKRTTSRTSKNIYRQFVGKCQLSDEVSDAVANKYRRKK